MSIIVPSNYTRIGAWVNRKMSGRNPLNSILCNFINRHARISHKHRRHGELGLQLSLLHYIVEAAALRSIVLRYASAPIATTRVSFS